MKIDIKEVKDTFRFVINHTYNAEDVIKVTNELCEVFHKLYSYGGISEEEDKRISLELYNMGVIRHSKLKK